MAGDGGGLERSFLVSGGSGGIGAAVCSALAERGYKPIVGYRRNAAAAHQIAGRCGGTALELDLGNPESIASAVSHLEALPCLAGAVLAGSPAPSLVPFGKITAEQLSEQLLVNVIGPQHLLAELVKRCFRKQKRGSVVGVLTSAMGGDHAAAAAGMGAYVIAKHGMAGLLALLAADYPWLRVRSVRPGYTETPMLQVFDERFLTMQRERAPFQTAESVAAMILQEAIET